MYISILRHIKLSILEFILVYCRESQANTHAVFQAKIQAKMFLLNRSPDASDVDIVTHKHLEKVGQYLRLGDLEQPVDRGDNFWHKFLRENPHVAEIEGVIQPGDKTSLALEKELLKAGFPDG